MGGPAGDPNGFPKPNAPRIEVGPRPGTPVNEPGRTSSQRLPAPESSDQVTQTLNNLYGEADSYLQTLTSRTGGRVLSAETVENFRSAFATVADELRNQYLIGYYSTHQTRDGKYHKIKLDIARKGVQVRARVGYRSPADKSNQ
jgi:VWFA-related protein